MNELHWNLIWQAAEVTADAGKVAILMLLSGLRNIYFVTDPSDRWHSAAGVKADVGLRLTRVERLRYVGDGPQTSRRVPATL